MQLISDVLDISKIEAGHMTLEAHDFNLTHLFDEVRRIWGGRAEQVHLAFEVDVAPDMPTRVVGDLLRLRQVLYNLLGNAFKFTAAGSVTLRVACSGRQGDRHELRFEISDTGIGISEDVLPGLFEEVTQADSSTTRQFGGTGLGLAICRNIVREMGGEIYATSRPGEGSSFVFTVRPGAVADDARAHAAPAPQSPRRPRYLARRRRSACWWPRTRNTIRSQSGRCSKGPAMKSTWWRTAKTLFELYKVPTTISY